MSDATGLAWVGKVEKRLKELDRTWSWLGNGIDLSPAMMSHLKAGRRTLSKRHRSRMALWLNRNDDDLFGGEA